MSQNNWTNNNAIVECRFQPSQEFFKNMQNIITKLFVEFPEYNTQNIGNFFMHTSVHPGIAVVVLPNRFSITYEKDYSDDEIVRVANEVFKIFLDELEIKKFERIGLRMQSVKSIDIEDAKKAVNSFINANKIKEDLFLKSSNITMNFMYKDFNVRSSFTAGIAQSITISNIQNAQNTVRNNSLSGILSDIDFYKENIEYTNTNGFVNIALEGILKCKQLFD